MSLSSLTPAIKINNAYHRIDSDHQSPRKREIATVLLFIMTGYVSVQELRELVLQPRPELQDRDNECERRKIPMCYLPFCLRMSPLARGK